MRKEYDFSKGKRGPVVPAPAGRTRVLLTLDDSNLDWLREHVDAAGGGDYSDLVNEALDLYIKRARGELAEMIRRAVREELAAAARKSKTASFRRPKAASKSRTTGRPTTKRHKQAA